MMKSLLLLLTATLCGASNSTNSTGSRVSIHIPSALHHKEGEDHVKAEFGFKQSQSGSISAYVYYVETDDNFCNAIDYKSNGTEGYPKHTGGMRSPYILVTGSSGGCSAVTKVRHAQEDGAAALVIMNDACRCDDKACLAQFGSKCVEDHQVFKMLNDGSGSDVSIPSFLLTKTAAHNVTTQLKANQPVLMELSWGLKSKHMCHDPPVEYSLWTTAHDPLLDLDTYKHYRTISTALKDSATFTPRFSVIHGPRFGCDKQAEHQGPCAELCTNHGRYCAVHARGLTGNAIVTETLRRLCIHQHYGKDDDNKKDSPTAYLDYLIYHLQHCSHSDKYADKDCIKSAMDAAKINTAIIEQCFTDSGPLDQDKPNGLLSQQLELQEQSGVVALPALTVGSRVLEDASSWTLFEGICHHFYTRNLTTTPDICFKCVTCPNTIGCLEKKGKCVDFPVPSKGDSGGGDDNEDHSHKKKKNHGWTVFWLLVVGLGAGGGFYYYKKMQDNEGFGRPGGTLNSYFQLTGEEN